MKVCIHRGSKEIGGSCVEIVSDSKRLLIDMGLPLDAEHNESKYLPDIPGLDGNDSSLLGIIISHPHMDHYGLLAHISPEIPVIMGGSARRIATEASRFLPGTWPAPSSGTDLVSEQPLSIGPFTVTPFLVDHSGYDSYALLIESEGKRLFYSGDFRMHGRKSKMTEKLISTPPENIDVLLMEGTTLERNGSSEDFPSETDIENRLAEAFNANTGLTMIHGSPQNIDRMVSIFRACKKTGKTLIIDLYTAVVLEATGNRNIPHSDWPGIALYIPLKQRVQIKNNKWFDLLDKHSKNRIFIDTFKEIADSAVLMFRPAYMIDLEKADILHGAQYIFSQWEGYWEWESNTRLREWLAAHGIPKTSIHTSGHANISDLMRFAGAINPRKIVPIHTSMPDSYKDIFSNAELHPDGEYWEV